MESIQPGTQPMKELKDYWLILKRHWLPASVAFASTSIIVILATSLLKKPTYVAEGMLKFERTSPTSSLTGVGKEIGNLEPLVEKSSPLATEAQVVRSNPIIGNALKILNWQDKEGISVKKKDFLNNLDVIEIRGTDILKISYTHTNPEKAAAAVNTVMDVYLNNNILAHRAQAASARMFIEKQLPKAELKVNRAEQLLRQFKEKHQIVDLKQEANAAVTILSNLQQQREGLKTQIANNKAEIAELYNKLQVAPQQAVTATILSQSPGVQEVLKEVQQTQSELAIEQTRFQQINPRVINLKEKLTSLNQLLQERITQAVGEQPRTNIKSLQQGELQQDLTKELVVQQRKRQGLTQQLATVNQTIAAYQQRSRLLPQLEKEQRELDRHVEASQTTYSQLLQKIGEIRVAENQNVGNARIISLAEVPDNPTSAIKLAYLSGILLAIMAAGATIYILEVRDQSIKTVEQAKETFKYTLLAVIPDDSKSRKASSYDNELEHLRRNILINENDATPALGAAYRILQANLKFLSSDKPIKVIAISSSVPQEGKSTVSANLAAVMAQLGRRVLLIDADMHCPIQHHVWNLTNDIGLSNMLVEQTKPERSIRQIMPNLDILTSGVVPPNSIALLDSQRMAGLIQEFSQNYDFVIIDTPPLTRATDAIILGKMADGILLVVRPQWLDVGSAIFAKGLLTQSGQNVLGQVVNGVIVNNEPHSQYYFVSDRYTAKNLV